jgi:hypothetical protein
MPVLRRRSRGRPLGGCGSVVAHVNFRQMAILDYNTEAELSATAIEELSLTRRRRMRQPTGYGRFARAADDIRFAIEELPAELLPAAQLKVADETFDSDAIRRLYESVEYPLARRAAGGPLLPEEAYRFPIRPPCQR